MLTKAARSAQARCGRQAMAVAHGKRSIRMSPTARSLNNEALEGEKMDLPGSAIYNYITRGK